MPICFQLYDKTNPGAGPVILNEVDRLMCEHFGKPCDPVKYLNGWFSSIGFRLASGRSFDEIRKEFEGYLGEYGGDEFYEESLRIVSWLEDRYSTVNFYSPK